jgi:hypothetical protein
LKIFSNSVKFVTYAGYIHFSLAIFTNKKGFIHEMENLDMAGINFDSRFYPHAGSVEL